MATNSIRGEHEAYNSEKKEEDEATAEDEKEEEEEEALSLCDLPVNSNKEEDQGARKADSPQQEEFDFLLWGGPFSKESEMCVADEIFFQGQILPLCCKSFSSSVDASRRLLPAGFNRSESSRSESVTSEFRSSSSSSRSSSIRSQNSSSSSNVSSTITGINVTDPEISKPRMRNHRQFHTHPSPKPQLKASNSRQVSYGQNLNRKSSTWDFFRLGVAPAPEIELQDLKVRCSNNKKNKTPVSRNSSNSSSSDRSNSSNHGLRQIVMRGCKCSVETVPFDIMITNKSTKKTESSTTHAMKEKAKQKQRRKALSRHRTFEWIKELSHASYGYNDDEEEALLSNSYCNLT